MYMGVINPIHIYSVLFKQCIVDTWFTSQKPSNYRLVLPRQKPRVVVLFALHVHHALTDHLLLTIRLPTTHALEVPRRGIRNGSNGLEPVAAGETQQNM
jgi:hypothetical protein